MRNNITHKIPLLIAVVLLGIATALAISALRIHLRSVPTTATVIRVETRSHLAANPITELDLLNPSAVKARHQDSIYLESPGLRGP